MGAWGTGISSNDEYMDIYAEIMDEYNKGTSIQTALDNIVKKYEAEFIDDCSSLHNLYFAAAFAGWECGFVNEEINNNVKEIVISGSDIKCWRELQASPSDLKKREKVLNKFLAKISTPKANPKKPKVIKYKPALFEKGDMLTIQLEDGNYSGAVVLENLKESDEFGINLIVKAYLSKPTKATVEETLNAKIYDYAWYLGVHYKKYIKQIEKIGTIDIKHKYTSGGAGSSYSGWGTFVSSNKENYYCIKENEDISNISAFINLSPNEIAKRQLESVKRSFSKDR